MSTESVMPSNHLVLCPPLLLLPSIFPSIRVFSSELALHVRWPKYWSFSFSISRSNEYSGLISFRMDWLDLLAIQGTLKSLLQHPVQRHQFMPITAFPFLWTKYMLRNWKPSLAGSWGLILGVKGLIPTRHSGSAPSCHQVIKTGRPRWTLPSPPGLPLPNP